MACGPSAPIANQIDSGIFAGQLIGGTTLDTAKLQLGRMINYLVGPAEKPNYDVTIGGMHYETTKGHDGGDEGLGNGIIPDLTKVRGYQSGKYPLEPAAAELALKLAQIARDVAVSGRAEAIRLEQAKAIDKAIDEIKETAKVVSSLLRVTLDVVLA